MTIKITTLPQCLIADNEDNNNDIATMSDRRQ